MRQRWQPPLHRDVGVLVLLVVISAGIIAADRVGEGASLAGLLSTVFFPFSRLSARIMNLESVYNENLILRSNLMEASNENAVLKEYAHEIERLRHLVDFVGDNPKELRCTRVVHQLEARMGGGMVLDKGSASGLEKNMTVISPEGLVGRLVRVRKRASLVKRLIDPGFRVSSMTQRTRATGILGIGAGGRLIMEWVSPNSEVARGDTVISSGMGSITPKGILIGQVVSIHEKPESFSLSLEVEPFVDFRRLEEVFVVMERPPDYRALREEPAEER